MTRRQARVGVVAIAVALIAAACSSSNGSAHGGTPSTQPDRAGLIQLAGVRRQAPARGAAGQAAPIVRSVASEMYVPVAKSLGAGGNGNVVFSPASLAIALAMLRAGLQGDSASQLDTFLHVAKGTDLSAAMNGLDSNLSALAGPVEDSKGKKGTVDLWSANSLWGQQGVAWEHPFLQTLAAQFGTGMRVVDYAKATEAARQAINQWVSDETKGKIPQLIPKGQLDTATVLTLVNALYFKAPWETPFDDKAPPAQFTRVDGSHEQVPMMHLGGAISHASGPGWTAVRLPYAGKKLAMTVIVPDAGTFGSVRDQVGTGLLQQVRSAKFVDGHGDLWMPKFELRTRSALSDLMKQLGVTAPFAPGPTDFAPMSRQLANELAVSFILQQATITVDTKGTEAAAATGIGVEALSAEANTFELNVDRPFLFELSDTATGTPLFMGQVTDPNQS